MNIINSAIIFDMDGVVIDTEPLYTRAEIKLFSEYNIQIPENDWQLFRGCSEEDFFNLSMKRYNIMENKKLFIKKGRKYVQDEFKKNLAFMPGFFSLHQRIIKHHLTGLVTASPRHNLDFLSKLINLDTFFEHIISGDETPKNKPFPDPYIDMMKTLNVNPKNTVIIEDSITGINAALSSGAHVIAKTGSVSYNKLNIAHRIVDHLDEITIELLDELLQKYI